MLPWPSGGRGAGKYQQAPKCEKRASCAKVKSMTLRSLTATARDMILLFDDIGEDQSAILLLSCLPRA